MGINDNIAGPGKSFTLANKKHQRETVHAIYSVKENYKKTNIIGEFRSEPIGKVKISHYINKIRIKENYEKPNIIGEFRFEPISKVKISHHISKIRTSSGDVAITTDLLSPANSAEPARVMVSTDDRKQIMIDNCNIGTGSGTKIAKFQDPLKICTLFICIYFTTCGSEYFREKIKERWRDLRREPSTAEQSWLILHPRRSAWSNSREFHKVSIVRDIVGYKPRINNMNDAKCMDTYLKRALESELVMTTLGPDIDYLPVQAPLLDYLTEGSTGWKYPRLQELRKFQQKRSLTYSVLEDIEVRKIICGISSADEIQKFHEWTKKKHLESQDTFNSCIISMDVEEFKASYYDVMRMAGKVVISRESQPFQRHLNDRPVSRLMKDCWKQTPGKIMFGNKLTWCAIISLPYQRNRYGEYIIERIRVQPRLLEVLRDPPTCTGVGVRRDVVEIEDFYTLLSGESVELNSFVDLASMSEAAGYKLRARNMTLLGVQVVGAVLNKLSLLETISGDCLGLIFFLVSRCTELETLDLVISVIPYWP